jgi:predicted HTH transcriptional regulator
MMSSDLLDRISAGENSQTQFKQNVFDSGKLAEEFVAFSNAEGGALFIGFEDHGEISGLSEEDISRLNQLISNVSNENVKPPIYPLVQTESLGGKKILVVWVKKGSNKPYCTASGIYWTKSGADKRKMSPEELRRLFSESGYFSADEMLNERAGLDDLDYAAFHAFFKRKRNRDFKETGLDLWTVLENLNLCARGHLTLAGTLFFGIDPQRFYPLFTLQGLRVAGTDLGANSYSDKKYFSGTLKQLLDQGMMFLNAHLQNKQDKETFNTPGKLEIDPSALEEALVNALIHRDYFIAAPIKVFVFDNRVEIMSPGKLPNSLTVEKIKSGLSVVRNPVIHSIAPYVLEYSGFGTGIERIIRTCPGVHFENDIPGERFICTFPR